MKCLFTILSLLFVLQAATAQNYECIKPSEKQYFIDGNNYLRGMRIDSTRTSGDTSFYYPYHTPRGNFDKSVTLDTNGGSWFGAEIIEMKNGVYWFFNHWTDTLEIRAQAKLNDKWICFHDTNDIYYEAQVTSIDTATVLGVVDSIKTITIAAFDKSGANTSAPAHGLKFIISANNGFYKTRALYFFPYHYPGDNTTSLHKYEDYYTYKVGGFNEFSQIEFRNPRLTEVYDFNVGDIFYILDEPVFSHHGGERKTYDSIYAVRNIAHNKEYDVRRIYNFPVINQGNIYYKVDTGNVIIKADSNFLIKEFPEEYKTQHVYHYYPNDTSYCKKADLYQRQTNQLTSGGTQVNIWLDVIVITWRYKVGIGLVHHHSWKALSERYNAFNRNLKFYRIAGKNCGIYSTPTNISRIFLKSELSIYPNPATGNAVYIDMPKGNGKPYRLTIYDVVGRQQMTKDITNSSQVDVSTLVRGVYLFVVATADERITIQ